MHCTWKLAALTMSLWANSAGVAQDIDPAGTMPEGVEVIVVSGNKTLVPLWQVSKGDHTMWILAYVQSVPMDVEWDYSQLEQVIRDSQEYIRAPGAQAAVSPLLYLNPVNIVRGLRLVKRLQRNTDKKTLSEVLPAELYQRYAELKAVYFPNEKDIELMRPYFAGMEIRGMILRSGEVSPESALASIEPVLEQVERQIRRNRQMRKTDPETELVIEGRFGALAERAETMVATIPAEMEIACFESGLDFPDTWQQTQLDTRNRARAWAINDIDTLIALNKVDADPCDAGLRGSSEGDMMSSLEAEAKQRWLDATGQALKNNVSTFSMLSLSQLLGEGGLLAELQASGYVVTPPAPI